MCGATMPILYGTYDIRIDQSIVWSYLDEDGALDLLRVAQDLELQGTQDRTSENT
jgi:hypothetical protein